MVKTSRIFLVGCNESDVNRFRDALADLDCRIETVARISDCLELLQRFQPHLVLLDSTIADGGAFDLCRRIKRDRATMVLMVISLTEHNDFDRAVDAGVDDFISKPINKHAARKRVTNLLKLRETFS